MKAVFIERHGGPEELKFGDRPDPVAKRGDIVVDINAASVNASDWKVRTGESLLVEAQFPHILGRDFSGVVSAVGEGVEDLRIGDAEFAVCD
jgi:NADPH:quinone reductase-like Zn-dependent oxidoreductase